MTEDDLLIANEKYLDRVGIIIPLPSGRIALLNNQRVHVGTFTSWESLVIALQTIKSTIQPRSEPPTRISLEALGLL